MSKKDLINIKKELTSINNGVNVAFKKVGSELSDHLDTINANTSELDALTQMITVLEQKIDKLNERIDTLSVSSSSKKDFSKDATYDLSIKEQEVFATLYTSNQFLSIKEISKIIGRTDDITSIVIKRLIKKDIPIFKKTVKSVDFFSLDGEFKNLQAKNNVVHLHEKVLRELQC